MTRALIYKELREMLPIVAMGLAALLFVTVNSTDRRPVPGLLNDIHDAIPFLSDAFHFRLALVAGIFALALGFWQTIGDFRGDAQLFLLHRPVTKQRFYGVKLATGLSVYLLCTAAAILGFALWAATPGTHASPFDWTMTLPVWRTWLTITAVYLGAALCGIYPAAWLGTRLAPLLAVAPIVFILQTLPVPGGAAFIVLAVTNVALTAALLHVVSNREFA